MGPAPILRPVLALHRSCSTLVLGLLLGACGEAASGLPGGEPRPEDRLPNFSLIDVNPSSSTFDRPVSPRAQLEKVSGWYFTRAS